MRWENLEREMSENLCCPVCKGDLMLNNESLVCSACNLIYPCVKERPMLVPFVAHNDRGTEALLGAARELPARSLAPALEYNQGSEVEDFFFNKLFPAIPDHLATPVITELFESAFVNILFKIDA